MKLKDTKIVVTGGAGFIGSHLTEALVGAGACVTVVDNFSTGNPDNLKSIRSKITINNLDIRDFGKIKKVLKNQDIVFHLAANADVPKSALEPDYDFTNNVVGTYNVIKGCLQNKVNKLIFAASAAIYGEPQYTPIDEKHPISPLSLYGTSKVFGENLGFAYHKSFGLPFVSIRIFNNYGARQSRFVMYDLLTKLYRNPQYLEVIGTGEQIRDYCYVTDGVRCFMLAAQSDNSVGQAFNLASGQPTKIKDLVHKIISVTGFNSVKVTYTNQSWKGDINTLVADTSKTQKILGFTPRISLDEGIDMLHRWFVGYKIR
ncbi:hypothetical protein A2154_00075 [Candidatus Gottesmanbacteria bacterium RBG_16_43_7]|uniref:NAD(P)-binding domain-containing protein n=1 Tax=Candidatus Gottesmanbacteria bacterium RBG_16_43_7 TaxID=1798373 RepID=A0A1F5Z9J6_9BACT|nr:MAG: hypothetical protein A2154_00075 [Candidatus Gottesmanbacteria bacterium RBG_16_43_7]